MTNKLKQNLELFKNYIEKCGYKALRTWSNDNHFYAQIEGKIQEPSNDFSAVFQGGTVVKLAYSDLENQIILKNRVFFKK